MKKRHAIIASAALLLVGCANDETVVNNTPTDEVPTGAAIDFNLTVPGQTRSTLAGSAAATKLNNEFVVFGVKNAVGETAAQSVFKNYLVKWTDNTAGTTESNTNNWEYVGVTPYKNTLVGPSIWASADTKQTVKYWDYSATNGYTFTAFSGQAFLKNATEGTADAPVVKRNDNGTYTVNVPSSADLSQIFFSDRVTVAKTSYDKPVVLTFRNFGSKIRVGFYETVPGYKVTIDKFYTDSRDASSQTSPITTFNEMKTAVTDNSFVAAVQNVNEETTNGNTVNVSYYDEVSANKNQVKVECGSTSSYQYTLTLGTNIPGKVLGTNANDAIWDNVTASDHYNYVYPNINNQNPMLIRCDYTLTSEDGSGETIKVKNARVTVPTQYVQWKSNYAYTYLFKISNNTNGTTGNIGTNPDDPTQGGGDAEGLYPITFDAVVMEATDFAQETTTTVATNSVTSYAKDGYKATKDIYFVNNQTTGNKQVIAPSAIADVTTANDAATKASVYSLEWSNTSTPTEGDVIAQLTGLKNGLTLKDVTFATATGTTALTHEVPSADGTKLTFGTQSAPAALKFTPNTAGNYAYIYCTTKYVAPTYAKVADSQKYSDYQTVPTFYFKTTSDVYFVASGITATNFDTYKSQLYTQTAAGTAGVYDVKVITVAAN